MWYDNQTPRMKPNIENYIGAISDLSEEYYSLCEEMGQLAERKGEAWLVLRKECKTNAECDQKWAATADGKRENYLKWFVKGLQAKRGSLILRLKSEQGTL